MSRPPPDPIFVLRGSTSSVTCLKFFTTATEKTSKYGTKLISGTLDGKISLWNLKSMRPEHQIEGHAGQSILALGILRDGTVLSHGRNGHMKTWSLEKNFAETDSFPLPVTGFCQFSTLEEGNSSFLATAGSSKSEVNVLDIKSKNVIYRAVPGEEYKLGMCMCVKIFQNPSTNKPLLLIGYENGTLALWDITAGQMLSSCCQHDSEPVMCLDVDQKTFSRGVTGSVDSKIALCNINYNMGCLEPELTSIQLKTPGTGIVRIRQDTKIMAAGCWSGKIRIYAWKKTKPLAVLNYHNEPINSLGFSSPLDPADRLLAAGCKDGRISLWSIYSDK